MTTDELARRRPASADVEAITDVDCTQRPRWRETPAAFAVRMAAMGVDLAAVRAEAAQLNREAALRSDGATYWTHCACGWCGLRVADPEVARREYDAHACAVDDVGQAAVDRRRMARHRRARVNLAGATWSDAPDAFAARLLRVPKAEDDFEARCQLLEIDDRRPQ